MRRAFLASLALPFLAGPALAQAPGAACPAPLQVLAVLESPGDAGSTWRADIHNPNGVPVFVTVDMGSAAGGLRWAVGQEGRAEARRQVRLIVGQSPLGVAPRDVAAALRLSCRTAR